MTFGEYIKALYSTGLFGKSKGIFAKELFIAAITSPRWKPNEETVKSWMYGKRRCDVRKYFPNGLVDKSQFITYFSQRTKDTGSWEKIQNAFQQLEVNGAFCIDLETKDINVFFWSLLNQFERIFQLPESEREEQQPAVPATEAPQEPSPEQIHTAFLWAVRQYHIMDIINREPPILNRKDWDILDNFVWRIEGLRLVCASHSSLLCVSITAFIEALNIKAYTLNGCLNITFGPDDENASFNMEGDEGVPVDKAKSLGLKTIQELLSELLLVEDDGTDEDEYEEDGEDRDEDEYAIDPIELIHLAQNADWKIFRGKMNHLYDYIASWKDEA